MVRGLEDDEVDFLELVDRTKLQEEIRVRTEESSAIAEYRCRSFITFINIWLSYFHFEIDDSCKCWSVFFMDRVSAKA